jgi:beta-aspartyl-dipeptidase (metallo-type)
MLTLIKNGDLFDPAPRGRQSLLLVNGKIGRIGRIDQQSVESSGLEVQVVDAEGCLVTPGRVTGE